MLSGRLEWHWPPRFTGEFLGWMEICILTVVMVTWLPLPKRTEIHLLGYSFWYVNYTSMEFPFKTERGGRKHKTQKDSERTEWIFLKMDQQTLLKPSNEHFTERHKLGFRAQGITFIATSIKLPLAETQLGAWLAKVGWQFCLSLVRQVTIWWPDKSPFKCKWLRLG